MAENLNTVSNNETEHLSFYLISCIYP